MTFREGMPKLVGDGEERDLKENRNQPVLPSQPPSTLLSETPPPALGISFLICEMERYSLSYRPSKIPLNGLISKGSKWRLASLVSLPNKQRPGAGFAPAAAKPFV